QSVLVLFSVLAFAVSPRVALAQQFEAASVKPNTTGNTGGGANFQPGGRFVARNATLRTLIAVAYGDPVALSDSRMAGLTGWMQSEPFDIQAKAPGEFPEGTSQGGAPASGLAMLRALLAERFKLATHWETRTIAIYSLVTRNDGRVDPRLVSSSGTPGKDCLAPGAVGEPDNTLPRCGSYILMNTGGNQFAIHARGITMAAFA